MRNLYKIIFLFILVNTGCVLNAKNTSYVNNLVLPTATIATNTPTVCLGGTSPVITFTGSGGTAPYTFTYTVTGVAGNQTIKTTSGNSVTVLAPTGVAGAYIYSLVSVEDTSGTQTQTGSTTVTVIAPPSVPIITNNSNTTFCEGGNVLLSTSNVSGLTYQWYLNGVAIPNAKAINYSAISSGNYTISVTNSNGCSSTSLPIAVTVYAKIDPVLGANGSTTSVTFQNTLYFTRCITSPTGVINIINQTLNQSQITSYTLNWGDGSPILNLTSFTTNQTHTYNQGFYILNISLTTNQGCVYNKNYGVFVGNTPSGSLGNPGFLSGCSPKTIDFPIIAPASNVPGTQYIIDFGDGQSITYVHPNAPASVLHTYTISSCGNIPSGTGNIPNSFVASMTITNPCFPPAYTTVGPIIINTPPTPDFTITPNPGCINTAINLLNTSNSGSIIGANGCVSSPSLYWVISPATGWSATGLGSNGGNANDIDSWNNGVNAPSINFNTVGNYSITLYIGNTCDIKSITKSICIEPQPIPAFTLNNNSGCTPMTVAATNNTPITNCTPPTYIWSVGFVPSICGTSIPPIPSQTTTNSSFNFTEPGTYTITLTATNSCGSFTTSKTVTVKKPPTVSITPIPNLCQTLPTTTINPMATVTNCGTQSPMTYEWSFPSGTPSTATTAIPGSISYSTSGTFSYSLKVTNECGSTSASGSFTINPSPTITGTLFSCISSTSQLTGSATAAATSPWTSSLPTIATVNNTGLVTGVSAGTTTITYTNSLGCKTTASFTVNPTPVVSFSIPPQTICSGDTSAIVTLSSVAGATINWTATQPVGLSSISLSGTNTIPAQTLTNSTNANIVVTYNATATLSSGATCSGSVFPYTITVKPKPLIAASITAVTCSGSLFTVTPTNGSGNSIPTGTTYSWSAPVVTGGLTGGTSGTNQTTISGTLTNPTNSVQTATYSVTPSFNGCSGSPFDVVVTVNPKPDVTTTPNVILCNGETSLPINFTGTVIGTTYTWSSSTTSIGIAINGTNSIPSFNAINTGTTPIIATITVIPSANSCSGPSKTFTITVNPTPTVNAIANLVKCSGNASGIIAFTGSVGGTTFDWTNDTPSIGLAATGSGNITSFTATNSGLTPLIATITVSPKANGCPGTPITFTITVNPTPTVDLPLNQIVCNGQSTTAVVFSGAIANTTYNWVNNSPTIGIGATGTGDIPPFTAINNGTSPIVATISVTPNVNSCPGASKTFTITINPSPAVTFTPTNQIICSGSSSALVNLSSTAAGTNFTWTAVEPTGISGVITSGTNTIPVQTLTNSTNLPIVITYVATAESTSGVSCQGITYSYTITVNPVPSITTTQAQTICTNTAFSVLPIDGAGNSVPTGTTYSWGMPVVTGGISGGAALSNQTTIKGTLINPTDAVQTATYNVTPKSGNCNGAAFTVVITVNPAPKVLFSGANQTLCSGSATLPITLSSPTTGNVTFNWTANVPTGISVATASGTDTIPTQTLVNTTTAPLTVIYTATATLDTNGVLCTGQPLDYKIMVNPAIITSSILSNYSGFNVSAVGVSDGSINVTVTGGSGVYTYLWSGPGGFSATSQDISNVPAGAYSLLINDGLCSPITLDFVLTSPMPLLIQEDVTAHLDILCFSYLTGAIKVDITQQSVGPYDYLLTLQGGGTISSIINSAATTYTFTSLAAGIYDIKVTDANGSVKILPGIVITQPSGITATISAQTNVGCAGDATGSATVTASGGNGTLTYSWNTIPIQTTATATGLTAGTYTVTITDANTCSIQKQAIIIEPNAIITTIASQTNVLCFGNNTGSATISASGGSGVLSYSWDTVPVQTTATATGLSAGTYNLTVTDENGCAKTATVIITEPSAGLTSTISNSSDVSCFGGNDGNATATVSGGTAPYSYSWNTVPAQTLATATGLKAGNYSVSISDVNGCSTSTTVTIKEPLGITANITDQTNVFCSGNSTGSATATAVGGTLPYSYSWNTSPVQTSDVAVNLPIGTYTVTVTDAKGCTTTAQATITEPNGIVTSIASQTNVDCFGNSTGAVTISASGGAGTLSYSWDTTPVQTTPSLVGLIAGTYNLTVTDANNCTKVQTVIITEPDDIVITTDLEKDIRCFNAANGEIKITITGGTLNYNIAWTKNGIAFATTEDLSNLSPGIYVVTVSDANNCGPKTATFTITEPPILAITLASQTNILCFGQATGAITVTIVGGTAPYIFAWTGPNGFSSSNQNLTNVFAGTYNLVVTDNLGCTETLPVTLTQPTAISITATTTPIICYGANNASISIAISGGVAPYSITWSNLGSGTFQDNLSAGDYLITVTDANTCIQTLTVNIPEAPIFTINPVVKNITCFGDKNGSINLNIVGGIAPVKLVWDDSAVAGTVRNNLGPGSYTATITDGKPCIIKRTFIILEPQLLVLSANVTNAFDCANANSGAINLLVSGGSAPFTYSWSNGSTTEDLVNIPAGNYLVTVKDANGCSKQAQYSINRPPPIVTSVETKTDFNCDTKYVKQTFVAKVTGGVPPYQLVWSSGTVSGPNNELMNTSQNGTVILNATDAIGCKSSYTFTVDIPTLGTPFYTTSSYAYSTYGTYSINDPIQFTNTATGDYISMIWDFGDGGVSTDLNPVHTFINPKEYVVTQTVTYPFGCVYVQKITFIVGKGYLLVVPTAFTPNNDSLNDTFRPVTKGLKNIRMDVYDTWGSMIYSESGDLIKGWDGKIKGNNSENGNYYCKVSGETFYGINVNENTPFVLIK